MSNLEILANVINLLSVILAARNHVGTWSSGIIGCILFGILFFQVKLYADVTLQFFFIVTSIYGWRNWIKGGKQSTALSISQVQLKKLLFYLLIGVTVAIVYGYLLLKTTDASFPFVDSLVLTFSVIAQLLMMERKLESWTFWILVNSLAVPLFATKGLYLTSLIYAFFWINAIWGYFRWRREFLRLV